MSTLTAKALYNFTPSNSTELCVTANETLYVINRDVGNGFSNVRNVNGEEGIVPSNIYKIMRGAQNISEDNVSNIEKKENDDDDLTDSSDHQTIIENNRRNDIRKASLILEETVKFGTVRMSNITPSETEVASNIEAKVEIIKEGLNEICRWKPLGEFQSCQIQSYGVDCKGLQKFITYKLNSSYSESEITRNFKEFEWFRTQLREKYPCIVIPQLPPRDLMAKFKSQSVDEGKKRLQIWLNYIIDHPVISYNNFTKSFFMEKSLKSVQNKRLSSIDDYKNREFYNNVDAPSIGIDWNLYSKRIDKVSTFIEFLDKNSFGLQEGYNRFHKDHSEQNCKMYEKLGNAVNNMYITLSLNPDNDENDLKLLHGIENISNVYGKVGNLFKDQAKINANFEEHPLEEIIYVTKEIPTVIELSKCIVKTVMKNSETKVDLAAEKEIDKSIQVIARTVDAELYWLKNRRDQQLKSTVSQYLRNQIQFFTEITSMLNDALSQLEN